MMSEMCHVASITTLIVPMKALDFPSMARENLLSSRIAVAHRSLSRRQRPPHRRMLHGSHHKPRPRPDPVASKFSLQMLFSETTLSTARQEPVPRPRLSMSRVWTVHAQQSMAPQPVNHKSTFKLQLRHHANRHRLRWTGATKAFSNLKSRAGATGLEPTTSLCLARSHMLDQKKS